MNQRNIRLLRVDYLDRLLIRIAHKVLDRLYFIVEQIDWFYNGSLME